MTTEPLTTEEIANIARRLRSPRDRLLLALGLETGLRISELLTLHVKDVFGRDRILIAPRNIKNRVARSIALNSRAKDALNAHFREVPYRSPWEPLFKNDRTGRPISRIQAYRVLKSASQRAFVEKVVGTHSMRKTLAKKVYGATNKDIVLTSRVLGHKNLSSTMSYLSFFTQDDIDATLHNL
jgi:integrase